MRGWLLIAAFTLGAAAHPEDPARERCQDVRDSCRETCTLEFGTDTTTRGRLLACLSRCDSQERSCLARLPARPAHDAGAPVQPSQSPGDR